MKVLHYTLGFPPERSGGLVKYAMDLMNEQKKNGDEVIALYPGEQQVFNRKFRIKEIKTSSMKKYKITNGLPLALFGGIKEPEKFMKKCDKRIYGDFLKEVNPDVIHIHTLMGIHKEFFEAAKELDIKIVFTSHDYYGLAPVPDFYANERSYDEENTNHSWNLMSNDALSIKKLYLFQNKYYPLIRRMARSLKKYSNSGQSSSIEIDRGTGKIDYTGLMKYYKVIFEYINFYHFNSSQSKEVYRNNGINIENSQVMSITNAEIKEKNVSKKYSKDKHVVAYIGPDKEYKGYYDFIEIASKLDKNKYSIQTYGHEENQNCPSFITQKGRFSNDEREKVYSSIDILIVPSRWKETFGLIVLEALSYGVNVFVSDNVGSKDLLKDNKIYKSNQEIIDILNNGISYNENKEKIKTLEQHTEEIRQLYKKCLL